VSIVKWLVNEIVNYYFAVVAYNSGVQTISSLISDTAEGKVWKVDHDLIKNAIHPIHLGHNHWATVLVIVEHKSIVILDSLGPHVVSFATKRYEKDTKRLKRYLVSKTHIDVEERTLDYKYLLLSESSFLLLSLIDMIYSLVPPL